VLGPLTFCSGRAVTLDEPMQMHCVQVLLPVLHGVLLTTIIACSSGKATPDDSNENEQMERATALCARRCDKEIATRCEATPSDGRSRCISACTEKYNDHPDCSSSLISLDSCRAVGGTYTCDAGGRPLFGPVGLCEDELGTCVACTGAADACR
jgi:hypothetical protein